MPDPKSARSKPAAAPQGVARTVTRTADSASSRAANSAANPHRARSPLQSAGLAAAEGPRAIGELWQLSLSLPLLGFAAKGDGHPVLLLPGLLASDTSTALLRGYLNGLGYRALPWQLGRNLGGPDIRTRLVERFAQICDELDEPVSLVGQSLGGVFARLLARQFPGQIRQVITLGSPLSLDGGTQHLSMPNTSIFSRSDGVVPWRHSLLKDLSASAENIEVWGSHIGMSVQPAVWYAVADRLQYQPDSWRPFAESSALRWMYPSPTLGSNFGTRVSPGVAV